MNRPPHQRLFLGVTWALAGVIALGSLLDAVSNAISLVTPTRAVIVSVVVLLLWFALEHRIRRQPLDWAGEDGTLVRIKGLGWSIRIGLMGALMLLWLPVVIPAPRNPVPPAARVLYEDLSPSLSTFCPFPEFIGR